MRIHLLCLPLLLNPLLVALLQGATVEQGVLLPKAEAPSWQMCPSAMPAALPGNAVTQVRVRSQPHQPAGVSRVPTPVNASIVRGPEEQLQV